MSVARGFGGIVRTPRQEPPAAAGVTGAQNGLSLAGTDVELGGNPLLHNTSFDQAGFSLEILETGIRTFILDPTNGTYSIGSGIGLGNESFFQIDDIGEVFLMRSLAGDFFNFNNQLQNYTWGDLGGISNGLGMTLDSITPSANIFLNGNNWLFFTPDEYRIGDLSPAGNGIFLLLDNFNRLARIGTATGGMMVADEAVAIYQFGDIDGVGLNSKLEIDDANTLITLEMQLNRYLELDNVNFLYRLGDIDAANNATMLIVDDAAQTIQSSAASTVLGNNPGTGAQMSVVDATPRIEGILAGNTVLSLDSSTGTYAIGPNGGNQNRLVIDDTNSVFIIDNAASDVVININGVAGFTGTVAAPATITVNGGIVTNVA